MPNSTTNYSFNKPLVNNATDADAWGGQLNDNWDDADSLLKTRTDDYDFAGNKIIEPEFEDAQEGAHNLGNISGAVAVDYTDGHYQYGTVTGNITGITISNWPASGSAGWLTLELVQDGTGGRTLTLASAYKTPGGAGITLSTGANDVDTLHLFTRDGGTNIRVTANLNWS